MSNVSVMLNIIIPGIPWFLEIPILIILVLFIIVFVFMRIIRYFRKVPMPAAFGALINAPHRKYTQPPKMLIEGL